MLKRKTMYGTKYGYDDLPQPPIIDLKGIFVKAGGESGIFTAFLTVRQCPPPSQKFKFIQ